MAKVKVKFRASSASGKVGTLCYHLIHQRSLRQQLPPSQSVFAFFRQQIAKKEHNTNYNLKRIGEMVGLKIPLTTYVARHTWASVALHMNIPVATISEGMGHNSYKTTQIYLESIDVATINEANKKIIQQVITARF